MNDQQIKEDAERWRWLKAQSVTLVFEKEQFFRPHDSDQYVYVHQVGQDDLDALTDAALAGI